MRLPPMRLDLDDFSDLLLFHLYPDYLINER